MKLIFFLISLNLFAFTLPSGSIGISQIGNVGLVTLVANPKCEGNLCNLLELEFTLHGCMDELGPVYLKTKRVNERFIIFINPINIHMKQSEGIACFVPKKVRKTFEVASDITLENLYFSFLEEND